MLEKYRQLGIKLTPQRIAILNFLDNNVTHPCAEEIYKSVLRQFPTMSFATVYNTLDALEKRGSIKVLSLDPDKKRYEPNIEPHHHLYCVECRNILDVHKDFKLQLPPESTNEFELLGSRIEFFGKCRDCRK